MHQNRLSLETSPYLLQHANNPVDWYAWGQEAFDLARATDKPLLISVGYSTCHWCHVMERESFEDEAIASFMNDNFVCIKVDREERPDVDAVLMEAVQALTRQGGWPLNCFLTPELKPFFGGTYFPPQPLYGRPSWRQALGSLATAWRDRRETVREQADKLTAMIGGVDRAFLGLATESITVSEAELTEVFDRLQGNFDTSDGGFGGAPKFPNVKPLAFLLDYHYHTRNPKAWHHVALSISKMAQGGIFDQIGGGFARYSTDEAWLAPHFEKMLYDNALLLGLIAQAYTVHQEATWRDTALLTVEWLRREMQLPSGGFAAAIDADSEGVEGKFYVWSKESFDKTLGEDAALAAIYFDVTEEGNWEDTNILWAHFTPEEFAVELDINALSWRNKLTALREKLLKERAKRVRPSLDHKEILGWNAMLATALRKLATALNDQAISQLASDLLLHLCDKFRRGDGTYRHLKTDGVGEQEAFLDDYAFMIEALLTDIPYGTVADSIEKAQEIADLLISRFLDTKDGLFFFSPVNELPVRHKDLYDNATPSGNATLAKCLLQLAIVSGKSTYAEIAHGMLSRMRDTAMKFPQSFAVWTSALLQFCYPPIEIAIVGNNAHQLRDELLRSAALPPNTIMQCSSTSDDRHPLLAHRPEAADGTANIYVCQNFACAAPVSSVQEVLQLLKSK